MLVPPPELPLLAVAFAGLVADMAKNKLLLHLTRTKLLLPKLLGNVTAAEPSLGVLLSRVVNVEPLSVVMAISTLLQLIGA